MQKLHVRIDGHAQTTKWLELQAHSRKMSAAGAFPFILFEVYFSSSVSDFEKLAEEKKAELKSALVRIQSATSTTLVEVCVVDNDSS